MGPGECPKPTPVRTAQRGDTTRFLPRVLAIVLLPASTHDTRPACSRHHQNGGGRANPTDPLHVHICTLLIPPATFAR